MKPGRTLMAAGLLALATCLPVTPSMAAPAIQLTSPIVELIPIVKSQAAELKLNADQQAKLAAWIAEAPAKRKAVEQEQIELRAKLREAILSSSTEDERKALIEQITANEAKLLTMRAKCTDFLRGLLTAEQFDKVVTAYKAK